MARGRTRRAAAVAALFSLFLASASAGAGDAEPRQLEAKPTASERLTPRLPSAPALKARERAPFDPVTKNRIQRYDSNSRAVIRQLDRNRSRATPGETRRLRDARSDRSRFRRDIRRRR